MGSPEASRIILFFTSLNGRDSAIQIYRDVMVSVKDLYFSVATKRSVQGLTKYAPKFVKCKQNHVQLEVHVIYICACRLCLCARTKINARAPCSMNAHVEKSPPFHIGESSRACPAAASVSIKVSSGKTLNKGRFCTCSAESKEGCF